MGQKIESSGVNLPEDKNGLETSGDKVVACCYLSAKMPLRMPNPIDTGRLPSSDHLTL